MTATEAFRQARDFLIANRTDYPTAYRDFIWPRPLQFNWATDWFDAIAKGNPRTALRVVGDDDTDECLSFEQLRVRSNRIAAYLHSQGLRRGDRILLMLDNTPSLWEVMLGAMKLGCPIIPATTLLAADELRDRLQRGGARALVTHAAYRARCEEAATNELCILVDDQAPGWHWLDSTDGRDDEYRPEGVTNSSDLLLLYFTSGTTSKPKLVAHTHASYPVGHLSTMYWLGLRPGDVHMNLSSPGWAKHAWSCLFAPWNAEATIVVSRYARFDPARLLEQLVRCQVTSFCAPPTVYRALIQLPLESYPVKLRELLSAGEPLNPEVIVQVRKAWGITIRDGYGQTETTLQIGNFPGQQHKEGSMGRPAPGYTIRLLDALGQEREEAEICVSLSDDPVPVAVGYVDDDERTKLTRSHGHYHTGDIASRDEDGFFTYVGRNDDVFKSSDYRISPFELESMLIEHEAIVEAAVVPSPDSRKLFVPKAFVTLKQGWAADAETARSIFKFGRQRMSPFKRIRLIEFGELPKTISGKIRRVELRQAELAAAGKGGRANEFRESDLS